MQEADSGRFYWMTENQYIAETEKRLLENIELNDSDSILEVGCAEGQNIYNLGVKGKIFVGIDINIEKLNFAASLLKKAQFICADAQNLPFKKNSFELVLCRDVLHHVSNRNEMIEEMIRVCKPNKKIIIIEANGKNLFWNIFGTIFNTERGVKKNSIPEFERLFAIEYADKLAEFTINLLNMPMLLRLLTHYKFGFKKLGNNKHFLHLSKFFNYLKVPAFKKYWPYIIVTSIKK